MRSVAIMNPDTVLAAKMSLGCCQLPRHIFASCTGVLDTLNCVRSQQQLGPALPAQHWDWVLRRGVHLRKEDPYPYRKAAEIL